MSHQFLITVCFAIFINLTSSQNVTDQLAVNGVVGAYTCNKNKGATYVKEAAANESAVITIPTGFYGTDAIGVVPEPRAFDEIVPIFVEQFGPAADETFNAIFDRLKDEYREGVNENILSAKDLSLQLEAEIKIAAENSEQCKKHLEKDKKIFEEYIDEVKCCVVGTVHSMDYVARLNYISSIKDASQNIAKEFADAASKSCRSCILNYPTNDSSPEHHYGHYEGNLENCGVSLANIPSLNPDNFQEFVRIGKEAAENGMRDVMQQGANCVLDQAASFKNKLDEIRKLLTECLIICGETTSTSTTTSPPPSPSTTVHY